MLSKNVNNKKCAPELIFFNEKKLRKIQIIFDIENWLWRQITHGLGENCLFSPWLRGNLSLKTYIIYKIMKNNQKWKPDKIYKLYSQIAVLNQKRMASWSNTIIFFQTPQQDNTQNENIVKIMCTCAYEFNLCTTT